MKDLKTFAALDFVFLSVIFCLLQFAADQLLPLASGFAAIVPVWWLKPSWRRWAPCIPALFAIGLAVDAFFFRHRLAVEARTWFPIFDTEDIVDVVTSPSGRTKVYVVSGGFVDSSHSLYLSTRRLFPRRAYIETTSSDASYPRDISASWNGPLFTAGDGLISVAFDERSGKLYSYREWIPSRVLSSNPPKTREAFAHYILNLR